MRIDFKELKKKYSCGPLLKKVNCSGRTIRVEGLDIGTAERINERVAASARQYIVEQQNGLASETAQKVFKKVR